MYRYARSKLANVLFTRALSKRLPANVFANAYFPGNIPTGAMDTWKEHFGGALGGAVASVFRWMGQSLEEGAATGVFLAAAKEVESDAGRGGYWVPVAKKERSSVAAEDDALAEELWVWSEEFVKRAVGSSEG
jgi:NAD(P)-dependent dehydrogenase (short-subunit alcohol dehydrogenase family)